MKSIREGGVQLRDSFARIEGGEVWIYNVHISAYSNRGYSDHEPTRKRKLLLHRQEIKKLIGKTVEKGMTLVPIADVPEERPHQGGDQPGQGQEGPRQARDDQAARNRPGNAGSREGKTVDYSPYEDESRGPHRGSHSPRRRRRLVHVPPRQRRAHRSAGAVTIRRRRAAGNFAVVDATLAGETKKAIAAPPNSRIIFKVRVPDDGWLKVSLGVKPEAWDKEGNGVYFFAGVSDGRAFEEAVRADAEPVREPLRAPLDSGDRRPLRLCRRGDGDHPEHPRERARRPAADDRNDLPLWGAPEIVRR